MYHLLIVIVFCGLSKFVGAANWLWSGGALWISLLGFSVADEEKDQERWRGVATFGDLVLSWSDQPLIILFRSPTVAQTGYLRLKSQPWNWTSTQPEMKWSSQVLLSVVIYDWLEVHVPLTHSCFMSCDWVEAHDWNMLLTYLSDCWSRVALFFMFLAHSCLCKRGWI